MYDLSSPMLRAVVSTDGIPAPDAKARFAEDRLLDAVIWCEILPGEIVTEADVMGRFGLTRAAARSGLMRLGYDGWAIPQPRTGWLISSVSGALIGQILEARRIAEPALAGARLTREAMTELVQIKGIIEALAGRTEPASLGSLNHYLNRVDGILLQSINPFTARHLRKLWHHTARITHFLEDIAAGHILHRADAGSLIQALLARDGVGVEAARNDLIDAQEAFFMHQLLKNDTPLTPGMPTETKTRNNAQSSNRRQQ